jgi:alcohol dehydrogenase class IV
MHSVLLPYTFAACAPLHPQAMRQLAAALQVDDAVDGLFAFARALDIPAGLKDIGLPPQRLAEAAATVAAATAGTGRPLTVEEATRLLSPAIEGAHP